MLATTITSSCRPELPAATALAVAEVIGLVYLIKSSAVAFLSVEGLLSYAYRIEQMTCYGKCCERLAEDVFLCQIYAVCV